MVDSKYLETSLLVRYGLNLLKPIFEYIFDDFVDAKAAAAANALLMAFQGREVSQASGGIARDSHEKYHDASNIIHIIYIYI